MSVEAERTTGGQPESDRVWSIETHGIDPIPDSDRHGTPIELFWVWCAANISILGITYGAFLVVFYSLNLPQAVVAAAVGTVLSFFLVGYVSLAGKLGGAPTLILSRASFGVVGNALPTLVSYISLVGWEIILVALSTFAAETVLARLGWVHGDVALAVSFVIVAAATIAIGLLGHATIVRIQTWFTWAFAVLTVVFMVLVWSEIDWGKVTSLPSGPFWGGLVGGTSIIMAGLGIGWVNAAADYSRYLPRSSSSRSVVGWTVFGASVAPIILIIFGVLLAANNQALATSTNPVGVLAEPLPTWFLVPYMIVAVGGLVAGAVLEFAAIRWTRLALLPLAVILAGLLLMVGARWMPRRTAKGTGLVRRVRGFRTVIATAETNMARFAEKENLFTRYLPYAIVFGLTEKWARAFEVLGQPPPDTSWYVSSNAFAYGAFSDAMDGFTVTTAGTIASTPSGSGGSGFGGGSAGGGGGGGGGGSW